MTTDTGANASLNERMSYAGNVGIGTTSNVSDYPNKCFLVLLMVMHLYIPLRTTTGYGNIVFKRCSLVKNAY